LKTNPLCLALVVAGLCLLPGCDRANKSRSVSGTIETDETRIASRYGGRVEAVLAREGQPLATAQTVVQLDAAELRAQRDQLAAQLAEAEAGPRKEEIAAAKADWESLSAQHHLATLDRQRAAELFSGRAVSEAERDRTVANAQALEKSVAAAKARYDLVLAGTRPERLALIRAQMAELETHLREMNVVSPTNAVLEVLLVKPGDVVAPNQPVATLLLTNHLWVRVFVPEPWLGHIRTGDAVRVRVDSFPSRDFAGTVEQIQRSAEFTPRNVQTVGERVKQVFGIKIALAASSGELRAGMSADVFFPNAPE
jgi:HlyD family secretion protein